ncbi:MAG: helix-turn-helix transcriptional regulator [Chloroflexi bacterium]|nr:helix-turn-helix transcriptional regulator [Chloroflexota bacterium]
MKKQQVKIIFRLDEILKEKGRGVREVAKNTGLSVATISRIVNHHTRGMYLEVIERLCNELEIEPQELLKVIKAN